MIKTKRLIALLFAVFALCSTTGMQAQTLDIDRQLKYCSTQVNRALDELRHKDGTYDYTMQPRNILNGDRQKGWNCRPAKAEEWCDGFWPGILWMTYQTTGDEAVRCAAEGYTESLRGIAYQPCYDHDIGFLMFCSYGKGYEVNCCAVALRSTDRQGEGKAKSGEAMAWWSDELRSRAKEWQRKALM